MSREGVIVVAMDLGAPHRVIHSVTDLDVLRVLGGTSEAMSGRRVARLVGGASQTTVMRSLNRLAGLGVLDVVEAGRALMFSVNREHLAAPALLAVADLRRGLIDALAAGVRTLDPAASCAVLFGSAARGDGDAASDIDVLVVGGGGSEHGGDWDRQIDALAARILRLTGNRLSVHCLTETDVRLRLSEGAAVMREIAQDGIVLVGAWPGPPTGTRG